MSDANQPVYAHVDVFAYVWGVTVGRTPLIKLSPKKTVEGFIGAVFSTVIFGVIWGTYFMQFDYMICPVRDLGASAFDGVVTCTPNSAFVWRDWTIPPPLSAFLSTLVRVFASLCPNSLLITKSCSSDARSPRSRMHLTRSTSSSSPASGWAR